MMMKTFVVNMRKDTQKRRIIEQQLQSHPDLDFQIWEAVEGGKLSKDAQKSLVSEEFYSKYKRNATLPAIGCALSHISIYKEIIDKGIDYALILEDDAILTLTPPIVGLDSYLSTQKAVAILLTPEVIYKNEDMICNLDMSVKNRTCKLYKIHSGLMTSGYIINKSAAKLLYEHLRPVKFMADAWSDFCNMGLNLYAIVPHIISYPDGFGEIGKSQVLERSFIDRIHYQLALVKIRVLYVIHFFKGERRSKKQWK